MCTHRVPRLQLTRKTEMATEAGRYISHAYYIDIFLDRINSFSESNTDMIPQKLMLDIKYSVHMTDRAEVTALIGNIPPEYTHVYTDGSVKNCKCGAGYVVLKDNIAQHQSAITLGLGPTFNQCELYAIYQAAVWLVSYTVVDTFKHRHKLLGFLVYRVL